MFTRDILPKLEAELNTQEIVVITGMRQVGKTTLLKYLFDKVPSANKALIDLENPLHRKLLEEENFDNVWKNLESFGVTSQAQAYLFIDEIQNLPIVSSVVKYLYDHWPVKFFLTGSSSFYLKNLFSESLSSRKVVYELFPLTFGEFLIFKGIRRSALAGFGPKAVNKNMISYQKLIKFFDEYQEFGGFPAVVREPSFSRKRKVLEQVFKSYFETDVKSLADFHDLSKLRDMILLLAARVGSRVDITKLSSELGIARETVYSYLEFLSQTYFISLLPRATKSVDRRVSGQKKLYLCDGGLANMIGKLSQGALFEQTVFQTLRPHYQLAYFAKGDREIDFIANEGIGLEVKLTAAGRDLADLSKRAKSLELAEYYVVSHSFNQSDRVIVCTDL